MRSRAGQSAVALIVGMSLALTSAPGRASVLAAPPPLPPAQGESITRTYGDPNDMYLTITISGADFSGDTTDDADFYGRYTGQPIHFSGKMRVNRADGTVSFVTMSASLEDQAMKWPESADESNEVSGFAVERTFDFTFDVPADYGSSVIIGSALVQACGGVCGTYAVRFQVDLPGTPAPGGDQVPTPVATPVATPSETPAPKRSLSITGYDGTDTTHMPLTFSVLAKEGAIPLAGEPLSFRFLGDVQCLADYYAIWDAGARRWQEYNQNLAVEGALQTLTNENGEVLLRAVLDFDRMRLFGRQLPCAIQLWAGIAAGMPESLIEQRADVSIRHPVFIRDIFFRANQDPIYGNGRWTRLSVLGSAVYAQQLDPRYGESAGDPPALPDPSAVADRITIDMQPFTPPSFDRDYFRPVDPWTTLYIDTCELHWVRGSRTGSEPIAYLKPGDGIMMHVLWADGLEGTFSQIQRAGDKCVLAVVFGDGTSERTEINEEAGWGRFAVSQGADFLIKKTVVLGATLVGGPAFGAWTAFVLGTYQDVQTVTDLIRMTQSNKMVTFRSEASITANADGSLTLHNFSGSPGVWNAAGSEIVAGEGQAIDFWVDGMVEAPETREPPDAAKEMQDVLADPSKPYAEPSVEEGEEGVPPDDGSFFGDLDSLLPLVPLACAASFVVVAVLAVGLLVIRRRSRRPSRPMPTPVAVAASPYPAPRTSGPPYAAPVWASTPSPAWTGPAPGGSAAVGPAGWMLEVLEGAKAGTRIALGAESRIGRSSQLEIVIDDAQASRQHAVVQCSSNEAVISDLGSRNGTFVNGARIGPPTTLRPGDTVRIGNTWLRVDRQEAPGGMPGHSTCTSCGTPAPAGASYCATCGAPVGAGHVSGPPAAWPAMSAHSPSMAPAPTPAQGRFAPSEPVVGVVTGLVRRIGLVGAQGYNLVVTPQRLVFDRATNEMLKDAALGARQAAKDEGKGFFGQWGAQAGAFDRIARQYELVAVDDILRQHPENFSVALQMIRKVSLQVGDIGQSRQDQIVIHGPEKHRFDLKGTGLGQVRAILRPVLGKRVR